MLLHNWRVANNMGPGDAARLLGVRPITVWRWETGRSMPSAADLRRIIELTGGAVTPNDFFGIAESEAEIEAQLMALTVSPERARKILVARAVRAGITALTEARDTFEHFASYHAAKPDADGAKKSADNTARSARMGAALALLEGVARSQMAPLIETARAPRLNHAGRWRASSKSC